MSKPPSLPNWLMHRKYNELQFCSRGTAKQVLNSFDNSIVSSKSSSYSSFALTPTLVNWGIILGE